MGATGALYAEFAHLSIGGNGEARIARCKSRNDHAR